MVGARCPDFLFLFAIHEQQIQTDQFGKHAFSQQHELPSSHGHRFTSDSYVSQISCCSTLEAGKYFHAHIITSSYIRNVVSGNLLLDKYARFGALEDACFVFNRMHEQNVFTWNLMIGAYIQHRLEGNALELFKKMQNTDIKADKFTFSTILNACSGPGTIDDARKIHAKIVDSGFGNDVVVNNALISMYSKNGFPKEARALFDGMCIRNAISWNAMIAAYVQIENFMEAFQIFQLMRAQRIRPDKVTFINILNACCISTSLSFGKCIHAHILVLGLDANIVLGNALVSMYAKCGSLENACRLFGKMLKRNVISWNTLISAHCQNDNVMEALQLFESMQLEGLAPDKVSFVSILNAYALIADLARGKKLHACITLRGLDSDVIVKNAILHMHGKCGNLEDLCRTFESNPGQNIVSWNTMISVFTQNGNCQLALQLFRGLVAEGLKPDNVTFINILDTCCCLGSLAKGKETHALMIKVGTPRNVVVETSLVNMYAKCQGLYEAEKAFNHMLQRNVISWNTMIVAYAENGAAEGAIKLFQQIQSEGILPDKGTCVNLLNVCGILVDLPRAKQIHTYSIQCGLMPDVVIETALVIMYGRCSSVGDAQYSFYKMRHKNMFSWNAMIAVYSQNDYSVEALELFKEMQKQNLLPDKVTFMNVLNACANISALEAGKNLHGCIASRGLDSDVVLGTSLVDMYGKCGCVEHAWESFLMSQKNLILWTAMLAAYAYNGLYNEACRFFKLMQMEGMTPDKVSFIHVLYACSHAGLPNEGFQLFISIKEGYLITPDVEHYCCMIDLLGRIGCLHVAQDLISNMPMEPTFLSWMVLLSASGMYGNEEQGIFAAKHVLELDPENPAAYVLLSNIHTAQLLGAN